MLSKVNFELSGDELLATTFNGMFPLFHSISSAQLPQATV
jgi:hypothetical protein